MNGQIENKYITSPNIAEAEKFSLWFGNKYHTLKKSLMSINRFDCDVFHDTYLSIYEELLNREQAINDFATYFYKAFLYSSAKKYHKACRYIHIEIQKMNNIEDTNYSRVEKLTKEAALHKDIIGFVRRKFSYEDYKLFVLNLDESKCSIRTLSVYTGKSTSHIHKKIKNIRDSVVSNRTFRNRWQQITSIIT